MKNKNNDYTLNTINSDNSSSLEEEIINEINYVRTSPDEYLIKIQSLRKNIKPKCNYLQINDKLIIINDIERCFDDLIQFLSNMKNLNKLVSYEQVTKCSLEFISSVKLYHSNEEDLIKNSLDLEKRMRKIGILNGIIAECIEYGSNDPEIIVLKLLLDEKNDKTDRSIILHNALKYIGVSCIVLNDEITISVLDFSENQMLKKDKLIINLNKKLVFEKISKQKDSAKDFIYKKKIQSALILSNKKYSHKLSQLRATSSLSMNNNSPLHQQNFKFSEFMNRDTISIIPKKTISINNPNSTTKIKKKDLNNSISNLKELKISTDILDKSPNLLKRILSPNTRPDFKFDEKSEMSFKVNAKIVNINLV